jgi:hypothetical protein
MNIPLAAVWIGVLCGYVPYSMGLAFLNPILIIGYGFLGFLLGANLLPNDPTPRRAGLAAAASIVTLLLALAVVNATGGFPTLVLPGWEILLSSFCISATGALAALGLNSALSRREWDAERIRFALRMGFGVLALAFYANGYLPYDWKMWLAEHTTNGDLWRFGAGVALAFVGIWRVAR